jgi:hypothetical protein
VLAAILKETKITSLGCAAAQGFAFMSAPVYMLALPPFPLHLARSLEGNYIGAKGASALAAVLKETIITSLKCASAREVFAFLSTPIDTPALSPSPPHPSLAVSPTTTSASTVARQLLPCSRTRRSLP